MIILSKNSRLVKKKTSKKAIQFGKLTGYKINIMKTNCFFPILAISIFSNWKWGNIQFSYKIIKFLDNNNYSHHNAMHSSKQSSQHPLEIDPHSSFRSWLTVFFQEVPHDDSLHFIFLWYPLNAFKTYF